MLLGPEKSLRDHQSRMNDSTRGQWDWYASHRRHIERLILPPTPGRRTGRICVLGAGNCNDLDLHWMLDVYTEVHLVDIDPAALDRALKRQKIDPTNRPIHRHAPIDLTNIADLTRGWKSRPVSDVEAHAAIAKVSEPINLPNLPGPFDTVLSPCVLSQLLCGVRDLLGKDHPHWPNLKNALRARHLQTINHLLTPAGRAVLVIDLASSNRLPGLARATDHDLPQLLHYAITHQKSFRGLEPQELTTRLRHHHPRATPTISPPWLWHLSLAKAFLVYAMTWTR